MEGEKVGEVILTMKDIDKSFPGVHALKKVSLEVRRGEVHAPVSYTHLDVYKRQSINLLP